MSRAMDLIELRCAQRIEDEVVRRKLDYPEDVMGRYIVMVTDRPVQPQHILELRMPPRRAARPSSSR